MNLVTLTMNFDRVTKINQKLKAACQKHAMYVDTANSAEKEAELVARLNELTADPDSGTALVDTARELKLLRGNREKQAEKVAEVETQIAKLKFLLSDELANLEINEVVADVEEFGL